jgi:hypothetical protein
LLRRWLRRKSIGAVWSAWDEVKDGKLGKLYGADMEIVGNQYINQQIV